ncbi:MAG: hypothetical protein R3B13_29570 [Polyangiaceae bacterium]
MADTLDADPSYGQRSALAFLKGAAARRASAIGSAQARQESLHLASLASQLGSFSPEEL